MKQWVVSAGATMVRNQATVDTRLGSRTPSRSEPDWAALVQRTAAGDQAALAELYDASSHLVFGLALRILGQREAAEDTVVEVYAQAWRDAPRYDPRRGNPCAWLLTLTRSRAIDMLRARRHEQESDPLESAGELVSAAPDPEEATASAERDRCVRRALRTLTSEQREAIELAYFSGLSHTEIASRLGQPLGTVKTRIRLGMLRLREMLAPVAATGMPAGKEGSL